MLGVRRDRLLQELAGLQGVEAPEPLQALGIEARGPSVGRQRRLHLEGLGRGKLLRTEMTPEGMAGPVDQVEELPVRPRGPPTVQDLSRRRVAEPQLDAHERALAAADEAVGAVDEEIRSEIPAEAPERRVSRSPGVVIPRSCLAWATRRPSTVRRDCPAASSVVSISATAVESHAASLRPVTLSKPRTARERRGVTCAASGAVGPAQGAVGRSRRRRMEPITTAARRTTPRTA